MHLVPRIKAPHPAVRSKPGNPRVDILRQARLAESLAQREVKRCRKVAKRAERELTDALTALGQAKAWTSYVRRAAATIRSLRKRRP